MFSVPDLKNFFKELFHNGNVLLKNPIAFFHFHVGMQQFYIETRQSHAGLLLSFTGMPHSFTGLWHSFKGMLQFHAGMPQFFTGMKKRPEFLFPDIPGWARWGILFG